MKKLVVMAASLLVVACASTHKANTSEADGKKATATAEMTAARIELSKLTEQIQSL